MKTAALFLLPAAALCWGETRTMTFQQAIDLALQQNPDVVLARLDQQKARDQVTVVHDPFSPKVYAGSGAAYTSGFPTSIDGNAPSIFEARTSMSIYDRSQTYLLAAAHEGLHGAQIDVTARQQDAAYRVASLFLDAENASRSLTMAQQEAGTLARVEQLIETRVQDGRELPIAAERARLSTRSASHRAQVLQETVDDTETSLAQALGLAPGDRVQPAGETRPAFQAPTSEEAAVQQALDNSPEVKRLESNLQAKMLEVKSYQANWLPKVDLVAQYSLLAKFNHFQDYFTSFQRNNGELGASFSIPLLPGHAAHAQASEAAADAAKLRVEMSRTRSRITADLHHAYEDLRLSEEAREIAREDLDLARNQTSVDLAQFDEGRALQAQVEQDRATENEKWLAYYDAQITAERAQLTVLRQTGTLLAAIK